MGLKAYAALLCAAVIAGMAISVPAVEAAPKKRYVTTTTRGAPANRPRARVTVAPRSFLDAGTEVLPGERKFLDYAIPPTYMPLGVVTNTGGRVGWHRRRCRAPSICRAAIIRSGGDVGSRSSTSELRYQALLHVALGEHPPNARPIERTLAHRAGGGSGIHFAIRKVAAA